MLIFDIFIVCLGKMGKGNCLLRKGKSIAQAYLIGCLLINDMGRKREKEVCDCPWFVSGRRRRRIERERVVPFALLAKRVCVLCARADCVPSLLIYYIGVVCACVVCMHVWNEMCMHAWSGLSNGSKGVRVY